MRGVLAAGVILLPARPAADTGKWNYGTDVKAYSAQLPEGRRGEVHPRLNAYAGAT